MNFFSHALILRSNRHHPWSPPHLPDQHYNVVPSPGVALHTTTCISFVQLEASLQSTFTLLPCAREQVIGSVHDMNLLAPSSFHNGRKARSHTKAILMHVCKIFFSRNDDGQWIFSKTERTETGHVLGGIPLQRAIKLILCKQSSLRTS
jgi:hypothetical protein